MDNQIIDLLRAASRHFQTQMKEKIALSDTGLSTFQAQLINLIGRQDGISQQRLITLTERDKAQVTRAMNDLEAAGFIIRSPHPMDKRAKCLTLTPTGLKIHHQLKEIRQQLATEVLGHLPPTEKQALQTLLSKVINQA